MIYDSPIGKILVTGHCDSLSVLRVINSRLIETTDPECDAEAHARLWLDAYFAGAALPEMPSLEPVGTDFQKRVWHEISQIPYGQTTTYGEIARRIGSAARAVGSAVGANPIAIFIPCHRVVAAGGIGGFAYGTETKHYLLNLESTNHLFCGFA